MPSALITGITGQDGFFLSRLLQLKGYQVFGFARDKGGHQSEINNPPMENIPILFGDITNQLDINTAVKKVRPNEIYHLASESRPGESWNQAANTLSVNGLGALHLFEAVRIYSPEAKVYHASTSEMFGRATISPQNEVTPFNPVNPYGASKVYAHKMARIYRERYGIYIAIGILFNHESERRPLYFVTQKIAYGAACAALGILNSPNKNENNVDIVSQGKLILGNIQIARDWGYSPDFVQAMWLMLQQEKPSDFVIGTGKLSTLKDICKIAYDYIDKDWQQHVVSDPSLVRPMETSPCVADTTKAQLQLGWRPSVGLHEMITKMVDAQIKRLSQI